MRRLSPLLLKGEGRKASEAFSGQVEASAAGIGLAVGVPIHDGRRVRALVTLLV